MQCTEKLPPSKSNIGLALCVETVDQSVFCAMKRGILVLAFAGVAEACEFESFWEEGGPCEAAPVWNGGSNWKESPIC